MFLRLFRAHTNVQIIVFFIAVVLLWTDGFYRMLPAVQGDATSPLYDLCFGGLYDVPIITTVLAFMLLNLEAFILNFILSQQGICNKNSFLPALIYMLLFSYCPELLRMHPLIPANLFLLLAIRLMWDAQPKEKPYQKIFTASLFISIAVLFDAYYLIYAPLVWIILIIYRTITWREWFIAFLGLLTPVIYAAFIYFWIDQLPGIGRVYYDFFRSVRLLYSDLHQHFMVYIIWGVIFLIFFPSFVRFIGSISEKLITIRRVAQTIVWLFILSIIVVFIARSGYLIQGAVVMLPLSIFIATWLQFARSAFWRELLLLLLTGAIIAGKVLL